MQRLGFLTCGVVLAIVAGVFAAQPFGTTVAITWAVLLLLVFLASWGVVIAVRLLLAREVYLAPILFFAPQFVIWFPMSDWAHGINASHRWEHTLSMAWYLAMSGLGMCWMIFEPIKPGVVKDKPSPPSLPSPPSP
jgi:hypothetical protein